MAAANAVQLPPPITSGTVKQRQRVKVSVKQDWTGSWQEAAYIEAIVATDCVAPSMPQARFRWRLGTMIREGETTYADAPPIDLRDWFVKIELIGAAPRALSRNPTRTSLLWIGRFTEQDLDLAGEDPG